jgi:hypothetical protein
LELLREESIADEGASEGELVELQDLEFTERANR